MNLWAVTGLRIVNVVDESTREGLARRVARSIGTGDVQAELVRLFAERGKPAVLRSDNGREFIATSLVDWLTEQGITVAFIEKDRPQQNAFVERFNGTMRDEVLNGEVFDTLLEARVVINDWRRRYNEERPHRALGMLTPSAFAMTWTEGRT
jgi:putative transposase